MKYLLAFSLFASSLIAEEPETLMQSEIKHVVVLMLENRSFDNVLGWLYEKNDPSVVYIPPTDQRPFLGLSDDMLSQFTNEVKDSQGKVIFSSPPIKGVPSVSAGPYLCSPCYDPNEGFPDVTKQIYNGTNIPAMTGFLQNYADQWPEADWLERKEMIQGCLETYTDKELPFFYGLARHYATCDEWFSSVPTQTNPNRAFSLCGTSQGQVFNGWYFAQSDFTCDTIWNRLSQVAPEVSWKIYWQADSIPIVVPGPFTSPNNFQKMKDIPNLLSHYEKIDGFHEAARAGTLPTFSYIEPQLTGMANIMPRLRDLDQALIPPFLIGWQGNDMHPPSDVRTVENLLANIYTSLIANEEAWNETLLMITFDEHGGIFDHISPPAATPPDSMNQQGFGFDRYGIRIPTIFISPKVQKKCLIRSGDGVTPFDHTSLLSTMLTWLNIDKSVWNFGNRAIKAPTFDSVITSTEARTDTVVVPDGVTLPVVDPNNVVKMGDSFYLRDQDGNYVCENFFFFDKVARAGSQANRLRLTFSGGTGQLTHGSFALIQGSLDYLTSSMISMDCTFQESRRCSEQWWTIKSKDVPYLGAPIQYGDRLFLENHAYIDVCQFVPCRLYKEVSFFDNPLVTKAIIDPQSDNYYWIIEKA